MLEELRAQIGPSNVVAIAAGEPVGGDGNWWAVEPQPQAGRWATALLFLLHAQMLALHASLARGKAPDDPFPAGEVNRVVRGVVIHPYAAHPYATKG